MGGQDRETAETFSDEDVIVRLLNLKAYTNFHYLAAEFNEAMEVSINLLKSSPAGVAEV